jgi:hypothetical protein
MPILERYRNQLNQLVAGVDTTPILDAYRSVQERVRTIGQTVANLVAVDSWKPPTKTHQDMQEVQVVHDTAHKLDNAAGDIAETTPVQKATKTRKRRTKKAVEVCSEELGQTTQD